MDNPEALAIAYHVADESSELVKLLVIGVRANGSVLILDSGLTDTDANDIFRDFRLWLGDKLGNEIMARPAANS